MTPSSNHRSKEGKYKEYASPSGVWLMEPREIYPNKEDRYLSEPVWWKDPIGWLIYRRQKWIMNREYKSLKDMLNSVSGKGKIK